MLKVVRVMKPFAIAVAPDYPIPFLSEYHSCLPMFKVVRFMRPFAMAVAPESPILFISE
jgi:hypothetical protein